MLSMNRTTLVFLAFSVFATGCGKTENYPSSNREIAEWAISLGGSVIITSQNEPVTDASYLPYEPFGLEELDFSGTEVTKSDLEKLTEIVRLERLSLYGTNISEDVIDLLYGIQSLQELELSNTALTDSSLEKLKKITSLKKLYVNDTLITKAGIAAFRKNHPDCAVISNALE